MRTFYYVHTGHRIGLDKFRRAVAILNALKDENITLLTSDYRIAQTARDFGIEKSVGIDVVRNIPQIAHNGDKLIFDSEEANPIMLEDMRGYFSKFVRISDKPDDNKFENEFLISPYLEGEGICKAVVVDDKYFTCKEKTVAISYFFGDDDYEKDLEKHLDFIEDLHPHLQLGFYYFLDYEEMLKTKFVNYFEFEEYDTMIMKSEVLITASPQAVLDSLASGGKPIYIQREDYTQDFNVLFESLNIPIIYNYDKNHRNVIIETINERKYVKIEKNCNKIANFLKESLIL
ncbi:hypothetical protein [Sulfurimonas autotrophica]|uniref:Uncharacterized protein n=1 Tax=Sulfurimonas autotrophica (strain ATCC BAA-671 / DSM 16294 / JCM 11897 / OK10) TaxID=563040 RepID=E0UR16_SULAO|nr:hypothetical protein [Sulfurimonas autotrophica]ADN09972.1 conserved hypothetical protein [Sulfurimonas autotrophica DSM 16294]